MGLDANGHWVWTRDDNLPDWDTPAGSLSISVNSRRNNHADMTATGKFGAFSVSGTAQIDSRGHVRPC